jgi:small subunit ribosomal protein S1
LVQQPYEDADLTRQDEVLEETQGMAELWEGEAQGIRELRRGDIIDGVVMRVDRDSILVDISGKTEGVIPAPEMRSLSQEELQEMQVGDSILVYVLQPENHEGQVVLSLDRATGERGWRSLQQRFDAGEIFDAEVVGYNKGGLLVSVDGVRGFVPTSQVVGLRGEREENAEDAESDERFAPWIGRTLRLKIIEINRRRNRLILSERAAAQEWRQLQKDRLLAELREGELATGTVTSIRPFGVFVDLGGADGLVHLSELTWSRNQGPEEVVKVGEEVEVFILRIDQENKKIALSLRRAKPEAWDSVVDKYQVGQLIHGTITKLTNFGAFAHIDGPVEGLIHISELADRRITHPKEVVKEGDVLTLKVVRIERERHRLGLSLKQAVDEMEAQERSGVRQQMEAISKEASGPTLGDTMSSSALSALEQIRREELDEQ